MNKIDISAVKEKCTGCGGCIAICPTDAITMKFNEEGFEYPIIDKNKCISCGKCYTNCHAVNELNKPNTNSAYFGRCKDENILSKSSSGGFYYPLANRLEKAGWIIYGAVLLKEHWTVKHLSNKQEALEKQMGSKYVQSSTYEAFCDIVKRLNNGERVLFSGTPCQVAGLKSIVGKNDNLLCVDFICHGVPSPKVLSDKVQDLEKQENSKLNDLRFRTKLGYWSKHKLYTEFENGKIAIEDCMCEDYFKLFLNNISLRKCCFSCKYSDKQHFADITIADYWGILRNNPKNNDEKGLSLIIINTDKGNKAFQMIKDELDVTSLDSDNASYVYKTHDNYSKNARDKFFRAYTTQGYKAAINQVPIKRSLIDKFFDLKRTLLYRKIAKKLTLLNNRKIKHTHKNS